MSKQGSKACKSRRLHFEVANLQLFSIGNIAEGLNLLVLVGVLNLEANLTALRSVETATSHRDAAKHFLARNLLNQRGVCSCYIRRSFLGTPVHVLHESLFKLEVTNLVSACIIVKKTVETDALHAGYEGSQRCFGLQTSTSTDTDKRKCPMLGLVLTLLEIDVGEGIQLVHHNVEVVATDTMTEASDAFPPVCACNGMKLTTLYVTFFRIEMRSNCVNPARVSNKNDTVSKLFRPDVKMENAAIFVDDELRGFVLLHGGWCYLLSSVRRISFSRANLSAAKRSKAVSVRRICAAI